MDNGWVFYHGPSLLTGQPIVGIVSGIRTPSENKGTGPMAQTHILYQDESPQIAIHTGNDESICGGCKLRGKECYVVVFQGPLMIWKEWQAGKYKMNPDPHLLRLASRRPVRMGSYGDPAAIPVSVWEKLLGYFPRHTGYTHQWRNKVGEPFNGLCQASCDNPEEAAEAQALGWKTFTIVPQDVEKPEGLGFHCTKQAIAWKRCIDCLVCDGVTANAWIHVHGVKRKIREFTW